MPMAAKNPDEPSHPFDEPCARLRPQEALKSASVKSLINYGFPVEGLESQRLNNLDYAFAEPIHIPSLRIQQTIPYLPEQRKGLPIAEASSSLDDIEGNTLSSITQPKTSVKDEGEAITLPSSPEADREGSQHSRRVLNSRAVTKSRLKKAVWGIRMANPGRPANSKSSVIEGKNFPLLASALAIPAYHFNSDTGKHPPAVILDALKLEITDSHMQEEGQGEEHDTFRIELEYGPLKWVIYRSLYDFYRLHYYMKKRYLVGRIRSYPRFPNQITYAFQRATSFSAEEIAQLALHRRKDLEKYLLMAIQMLTMQMQRELLEFLEMGGCSIRKYMGWKGREGYLSLRTTKTNEFGCLPAIFGRWTTCWVLLRDSYLVWMKFISSLQTLSCINGLRHVGDSLARSPWTKEHRYNSFAPIRTNIRAKWYIDGAGYFYELSEAILNAKDTIYIADWWLSPELYLRRPPSLFPEFRLDQLLKTKAEQGVDIYVLVFKEVTVSLPNNSQHTKRSLKRLHRNIKVQRHPDHVQTNGTWFWAHHEKICVVDNSKAFLGGLDLCFGRFDDNSHRLADFTPLTDGSECIFPGQDYCNPRVRDNFDVHDHTKEVIDRKSHARMPWHDIAVSVTGAAARDVARHFIERWNFIKTSKARQRSHIPFLMPQGENCKERKDPSGGTCQIQVLRSSSEWSSGVEKENSIYNAYIENIYAAQHFIYIENQFFVTAAKGEQGYTIKNKVGLALVERIKRAYRNQTPFRVIVVMPLMPAFPNELHDSSANTIRLVMQWQYQSICRGKESIMGQLQEAGIEPSDYIRFHGLRNYDLIPQSHLHHPDALAPAESIKASAFDLGSQDPKSVIHEERPQPTRRFTFKHSRDSIRGVLDTFRTLTKPRSEDESSSDDDSCSEDTVPHTPPPSLSERPKPFRDPSQASIPHGPLSAECTDAASQYVTEQVYIHSKLMIVDDRIVICGSANINDRSMVGYRDSEIAVVIEDLEMVPSTLAGKKFEVSKFAHTLRCTIFKEHLGLLSGTEMVNLINWDASDTPGDAPMVDLQGPDLNTLYHPSELVKDPLGHDFIQYWNNVAGYNTRAFREVFRVVPDDTVANWDAYRAFIPNPDQVVTGHPDFRSLRPSQIQRILRNVRGHLVEFPSKFLEQENFSASAFSAENIIPIDVFI
ncbi:hypothetical protein DSO57_1026038 [Entomophthora muscae]|uniref:Uncharacterized protein n=1 Tax=Entomophthora muscae TaxID=34485 RepID=A0ACC2SET9_9FUNG|nr:hypothetical protein DSO57_1026038 [Entomophthora muscae]